MSADLQLIVGTYEKKELRAGYIFLFIAILTGSNANAQRMYVDLSFDPNKAFGVRDNRRTEVDHRGLDFDFEIGITKNPIGVFAYYGAFNAANYKNFGLGADYAITGGRFELRTGGSLGSIMRYRDTEGRRIYMNQLGGNIRSVLVFWVFPSIGVTLRGQFQIREDIAVFGIFEGSLGLRYRFRSPIVPENPQ